MAIFLGNIKGLSVQGSDNTTGFNYVVWNYASTITNAATALPHLYQSSSNYHGTETIKGSARDLGYFIVSDCGATQTIPHLTISTLDNNAGPILTIASDKTIANATWEFADTTVLASATITNFTGSASVIDTLTVTGSATVAGLSFADGIMSVGGNTQVQATHIQAPYFNAVSDQNKKTNIKPLTSTLDIINNTPVYSFNYTDTLLPSIGIMAQDVEHISFDKFALTDVNTDGSLSIHESKLIYILWKGLQEQQELIKQLQAEITTLRGGTAYASK